MSEFEELPAEGGDGGFGCDGHCDCFDLLGIDRWDDGFSCLG